MSILIKGMEMPTNCCKCPVRMEACKRGYKYLLKHPELYDNRADGCPLIPVPEHGRLIDADALLTGTTNLHVAVFAGGVYVRTSTIEDAPTIIPADKEGEG